MTALPAAALSLPAAATALDGAFVQGGLVLGVTEPGSSAVLDGRPVAVGPDGRFVFGFGRDHPASSVLELHRPDGRVERHELPVAVRQYDVQRIDGLPGRQVTPDPGDLERIRRDAAEVAKARQRGGFAEGFLAGWIWPAKGPISGVYGSQRILNGEPRQPHFGIDIAAPEGSPVVAASDGQVTLAAPDLFFTGGTVIIDHGHGLSSTYSHLQSLAVEVGQPVRQGDLLGTVGRSGRATGPHLDWRLNWFDVRLDPALVVPPMPAGGE